MKYWPIILFSIAVNAPQAHADVYAQAWEDLTYLSAPERDGREPNSQGSIDAQQRIVARFKQAQLQALNGGDNFYHPFTLKSGLNNFSGTNVLAVTHGQDSGLIVLTAHYDHLGRIQGRVHPGADDNASGVAVMLALAHLSQTKAWQHGLLFAATDAEEKGLIGSKAMLQQEEFPLAHIVANLNLDMLGQFGRPPRLYLTGTQSHPAFNALVEDINATVLLDSQVRLIKDHRQARSRRSINTEINFKRASDHAVFADAGIPYLFLGVGEHPWYHTAQDSADRIDPANLALAIDVAWALLNNVDKRLAKEN
ncbi:M28 family peptidase [Alteromonas flava]|uniref:M28 family peptidase n=1 Tax=Alteromonas flava TaxID=2048003 RepID=UPI0013DB9F9A|nr:M28 family peptidase [Alteromonas flava]